MKGRKIQGGRVDIPIKPIYLLSDSQLLFWRDDDGELFLQQVRAHLDSENPKAAYVGAANGDRPEFYELFRGAMDGIGISDCRMIPAEPGDEDLAFFDEADLILLAGGDVRQGWRSMKSSGLQSKVIERYYTGAVLMGVSAGAVQLGMHGFIEKTADNFRLFDTFKLVPLLIDAHDEPEWRQLKRSLGKAEEHVRGLGIPSGAGAILHPDLTLEAVRRPLVELHQGEEGVQQSLIFPPDPNDETTSLLPTSDLGDGHQAAFVH
jgi:peptidase E